MNLKVNILSKLIETDEDIVYIVWRHWWAYKWIILKTIIFTFWIFLLYYTLYFISPHIAIIVAWTLWLMSYLLINIEFFDVYLDNVLFTPSNIITFKWFGLFNNTMDTIDFHSVESLYQEQHWFIDLFLDKWTLIIRRQWHENIFENIPHAGRTVRELNWIMKKYSSWKGSLEEETPIKDDFWLFVEAMWEIMREYKQSKSTDDKNLEQDYLEREKYD